MTTVHSVCSKVHLEIEFTDEGLWERDLRVSV